jgi:lysine 2,3-aminomutase
LRANFVSMSAVQPKTVRVQLSAKEPHEARSPSRGLAQPIGNPKRRGMAGVVCDGSPYRLLAGKSVEVACAASSEWSIMSRLRTNNITATSVDPDWRRLPGFHDVSDAMWTDTRWQRRNTVRKVPDLLRVFGRCLPEDLAKDIADDQATLATMGLGIPPHVLNTMNEHDLWADPIRRHMAPALSERHPVWPSHPFARRDSLAEVSSWAVEGLVHRYPSKVMVELTTTCPQYCGHCTRLDLVGPSTPLVAKRRFMTPRSERYQQILKYLRSNSQIRDIVVSGGDVANVPIALLERFVAEILDIEHVRSIRLASTTLISLPQYFLSSPVAAALERLAVTARSRDVDLALHTQANHVHQLTELVAKATRRLLDLGFRDVRNQGVLLRGVNATPTDLLELCEQLLYGARIMPYYFYVCDMIPNAEHWRTSVAEAQMLQRSLMGKLPGFAIPRIVCDVPLLGKRLIDQPSSYDRERGISLWRREPDPDAELPSTDVDCSYFDPIDTLPPSGQAWWRSQADGKTYPAAAAVGH